ncbi:RsmB/NOP family class I SAM-dependent RNA methyltransferase [Tellurirhabdus bombi]|uniref:RsmB/NOP family class I SAM-dependent RNA methyltransferase n=1 Tax=Tellurirhabdus bombi TaxID=2907205 RepID=UPI001F459335|nr:RsmB/NOP family class I SAM-dependent RNA methyltransferase [Tellurirhabdus bombi]
MIPLPSSFRERLQTQLGEAYPDFEVALNQPAPVSIRINPAKPRLNTDGLERVPWCDTGFYLPERPVFTLDPLFQAGAYYVQEASSMLLAEAVKQTVNLSKPLRVLDLCAAPGGKSTLLASLLSDKSLLVCNEVIRTRVPILRENIEKWGFPNVVISNHDPEDFSGLAGFFDLVLVDAPCSGEGLFRKDPKAVAEWSEASVQLCALRQQRILTEAMSLVSERGVLLYSTCTYNDEENVQNAAMLAEQGFQSIPLDFPAGWGITEKKSGDLTGYQCYPHKVKGEGFFLSVFRRKSSTGLLPNLPRNFKSFKPLQPKQQAALQPFLQNPTQYSFYVKPNGDLLSLPTALTADFLRLDVALRNKGMGLDLGTFKGTDFIPSHALALSSIVSPQILGVDLTKEDALRYFKKENLILQEPAKGWLLAKYEGLNLGWLKGVGNRVNNYLPKDWRIRMDIE